MPAAATADTHAEVLLDHLCRRPGDGRVRPDTAVVVAHPDDEVIGAGTCLPMLGAAAFIYVTDGAPRDLQDAVTAGLGTRTAYARTRRAELEEAFALAGIAPRVRLLGYVDQEASLHLADLARTLAHVLAEAGAEVVLTHPYEGGHPDHDATAFAVHAACRLLAARGRTAPTVVEMTSYHNRNGTLAAYTFLADAGHPACNRMLTNNERAFKHDLLDCFATQQKTLRAFRSIAVERFRKAPAYDFTAPPHPGTLYYEMHDWGMTGPRWRALARTALAELFD